MSTQSILSNVNPLENKLVYSEKEEENLHKEKLPISNTIDIKELLDPLIETISTNIKPLSLQLMESSPFRVKQRITKWFETNEIRAHINTKSPLIHNFAWAVNDILWQFGLRYPRENDFKQLQPALAMLCQVDHPFCAKKTFSC